VERLTVPEARLEQTEHGLAPEGDGWFVLNAREARWRAAPGRGAYSMLEGEPEFAQVGIHLVVLGPGEPMAMYHWEADQEDFLVLAGEALLVVEGEERTLRTWDFVHCPPMTKHVIVGAGDAPCVVLAVGARERSTGPGWGGYTVDEAALRHGAGVEAETTLEEVAYAHVPWRKPTRYREGWLPA
jgi:quercetin dioxygenase-like cupin family protein